MPSPDRLTASASCWDDGRGKIYSILMIVLLQSRFPTAHADALARAEPRLWRAVGATLSSSWDGGLSWRHEVDLLEEAPDDDALRVHALAELDGAIFAATSQ